MRGGRATLAQQHAARATAQAAARRDDAAARQCEAARDAAVHAVAQARVLMDGVQAAVVMRQRVHGTGTGDGVSRCWHARGAACKGYFVAPR